LHLKTEDKDNLFESSDKTHGPVEG